MSVFDCIFKNDKITCTASIESESLKMSQGALPHNHSLQVRQP